MRKISRKNWVRRLDALVKQIVIARDGECIVCHTKSNLTPGHLFSRVAYSTRWDLDNVYAQCLGCNFRHESDPYPMTEAVLDIFAGLKEIKDPDFLNGEFYDRAHAKLDDLHRKYITPRKFKTFELEELFNDLSKLI